MSDILHLLAGTYTSGESKGIYIYRFNEQTGDTEYANMIEVENPSYMVCCKKSKYVYAVSENEGKTCYLNAFFFDKNKEDLTLLNRQPTDDGPCNVTADCNRFHILTANYGGGSINVFHVNTYGPLYESSQLVKFKGSSIDPERQKESHMHCVDYSPDHKYIFATDLGADKIYRFEVDSDNRDNYIKKKTQKNFNITPGSGPRHFLFHPCGKYLYLINELSGTVTAFHYNNGDLEEFQTIEADPHNGKASGDIEICPNGNFLYASNRDKGDGVAIFSIDHLDGRLTKIGHQYTGAHPRNLLISPNGKFLLVACKDGKAIEIYTIDHNTGLLHNIQKDIEIDQPVCLKFI